MIKDIVTNVEIFTKTTSPDESAAPVKADA